MNGAMNLSANLNNKYNKTKSISKRTLAIAPDAKADVERLSVVSSARTPKEIIFIVRIAFLYLH